MGMSDQKIMRIFAGGIATETNTFSPVPTGFDDYMVQRGEDVLAGRVHYPSQDLSATWGKQAAARSYDFVFSLMAFAEPLGITVKTAYEDLRDEMLRDLRNAMPVDVVLLNLHGAMVAEGYEDCEEDMIRRVREITGSDAVIGVELDLHCHLSASKIAAADIVITYKEYPHVDVNDRARELFDWCVAARLGHVKPTMALFDCQTVGMYPTSCEPMRGFVGAMQEAEKREGVLSVSLGHGFQFADVVNVGAKVLVVTDNNEILAQKVAHEFGMKLYELRRHIGFESMSLTMDEALSKALVSTKTPVVVADQSDNIGGGAPGDSTFALRWLLERGVEEAAIAILYDPEVVKIAKKAGQGARLPVRVGGKMGIYSGNPVDIDVTVRSIVDNYVQAFPQRKGNPWLFPAGDVVALQCSGIDLIVSSERCQCFAPSIFSDLGVDPLRKRLLIVKSYQHFYGAFSSIAGEIIYMAAPGAVAPDPRKIAYRRLNTQRLYPWVDDPLGSDSLY
jgi:microcystin degradation protein MlrC